MAVEMQHVPRSAEGIRQCVAWPWPIYGALPTVVTCAIGLPVILFGFRLFPLQLAMLLAFEATIVVCSIVGIELLRRDYIGKL
jgi:hypothetical protein